MTKTPASSSDGDKSSNNSGIVSITLLFAAIALSCVALYHSANPFQLLPVSTSFLSSSTPPSPAAVNDSASSTSPPLSPPAVNDTPLTSPPPLPAVNGSDFSSPPPPLTVNDSASSNEEDKLEMVLKKAAMADRTVILTTLNEAWANNNSVIDLFLESFRIGINTSRLLKHLVIVALDGKAYARCLELHPYCYVLTTQGVDFSGGEAYFMTPDYLKMMWRRIDFLRTVLEKGFNFIFTDADIMWFRDPFPRFYPDAEFQIACDHFWGTDSYDINNSPNGGFNYVRSSNRTIEFYKFWYASREKYPGNHDQDVLNMIKGDPYVSQIGLQLRFLNTAYFGGFCEPSKDLNVVCTMHANCCIGLGNKIHDLRALLEDWTKFKLLPENEKSSGSLTWSHPQDCW